MPICIFSMLRHHYLLCLPFTATTVSLLDRARAFAWHSFQEMFIRVQIAIAATDVHGIRSIGIVLTLVADVQDRSLANATTLRGCVFPRMLASMSSVLHCRCIHRMPAVEDRGVDNAAGADHGRAVQARIALFLLEALATQATPDVVATACVPLLDRPQTCHASGCYRCFCCRGRGRQGRRRFQRRMCLRVSPARPCFFKSAVCKAWEWSRTVICGDVLTDKPGCVPAFRRENCAEGDGGMRGYSAERSHRQRGRVQSDWCLGLLYRFLLCVGPGDVRTSSEEPVARESCRNRRRRGRRCEYFGVRSMTPDNSGPMLRVRGGLVFSCVFPGSQGTQRRTLHLTYGRRQTSSPASTCARFARTDDVDGRGTWDRWASLARGGTP